MQIIVRDAIPGDLPSVLSIYNHAAVNTTAVWTDRSSDLAERQDWFLARKKSGWPVLVAKASQQVIGFGSFGDFRSWPGYRYTVENSVYVDAAFHRQGAARALLKSLIARAVELEKYVMVAGIEAANEASLALHRSEGFIEAGRIPEVGCKFGRWLDLIFLSRQLDHRAEPGGQVVEVKT
ncbi:GNAT family N-acetyltransferase [Bradyrhizobium prioriisuperbiae]|uniref:GNAT family N-acetyltransferase n=1 Tax=Bradyrhizobium prioriisuperbiae TaxID=2854389 RepID=UPI0028E64F98|nr:GNAT family N-acetyltransferase [Bradyrhizobium prioritasuperba]